MIRGHGKTRAYLQRFKLAESAICPCNKEDQNLDHILNSCALFHTHTHTHTHKETHLSKMILQLEPGRQVRSS